MAAIEIKNLSKKYGDRAAVDNISFSIEKGEFFLLLGLNGAGKTTTIKMLSCLVAPTSGDAILLSDSILTGSEKVKQKTNVSPQETAVAPNLSVRENMELMARIYGKSKEEAKAHSDELLKKFKIFDRAKEKAKNLSGGLQRRLSIAMALISDPEIVFLDEPTLGLDVRARRELWHLISELKGKVTIVLTTHYLEEAEALSDRIAIMEQGKVMAIGTLQEIKEMTGKDNLDDAFLELTERDEEEIE